MERYNAPQQPQMEQEETIDLIEVFHVLWKKAWVMALSFLAGAVILALVTTLFITPQYEATSTIYILSRTTSITSLTDLQIGSSLAADFQLIATTREVVERVIAQFGLEETYEEFVKNIQVTNPTGSHMLQIQVTYPDQQLVAPLSNALADELKLQIADVMNTDTPSTVERAVTPEKHSSPSLMINTFLGGLVAAALAAGIILVNHFLDDTIKDEEDVEKYLHLNTLAAIPLERTMVQKNQKKQRAPRASSGHHHHHEEPMYDEEADDFDDEDEPNTNEYDEDSYPAAK